MCRQRVVAATAGVLLRLIVAMLIGSRISEWRGSTAGASCRHQLVFDVYNGYGCDVIVTSSSSDDDDDIAVAVVSNGGEVPRNATALRLTLRRAATGTAGIKTGENGNRMTASTPLMHFRQLRSLEVDVSETASFPAGFLTKLGSTSLLRLSLFRSASTNVYEYQLRLPTSTQGTFATSNGSLSTLVLSDLGIEKLPLRTFDGLTTLCFLYIDKNRLSTLPSGLFDDLCQLSSLSLARNSFVDVEDLSLGVSDQPRRLQCGRGLIHLRSLDLHGNRLQRLHTGAFRSLPSVVGINLSGNELSVIDAGAFGGLVELRTLYIDNNQLMTIEPSMFSGLTGLTTLDISRNRLSSVASGSFRYLTALRTLHLHDNEIQIIRSDAWIGLDELIELNLASNRLTAVDQSTFVELCGLRELDLSDNELTVAEAEAFVCLTALERLDLSSNLLADAERRRLEERQWWSTDVGTGPSPPASCHKCGNTSVTTASAQTNREHSIYGVAAVDPSNSSVSTSSSSAAVRMSTTHILTVAMMLGAAVASLFLTMAVVLYLLRRRQAVLDCHQRSAISTYGPRSASVCSLDNSIHGIYVKFVT